MSELAIGYIRVSTDRQDEHSPETQLRNILKYFQEKRWQKLNEKLEDADIILDDRVILDSVGKNILNAKGFFGEAGSAYNLTDERERFERMIKYLRRNKIRHLVFYKANRFARNDEDWGVTKRQLRKSGVTDIFIHSIDRPQMVVHMFDKDETEKRNLFIKRLIEAEEESYQRHVDATEGVKTKFEKGQLFYKPPYGFRTYTVRRGDTKTHHVKIIREEMDDVQKMFDLMETGEFSLSALAKKLIKLEIINLQTSKPFSVRGIHSILTNVCYIGLINRYGETKKSTQFDAQIPEEQFSRVQKIMKSRDTQRNLRAGNVKQKYKSPFAELCRCHFCGTGIVSDVTVKKYKSGKSQQFVYLRCTSGKRAMNPDFYQDKFGKKYCIQPYNCEANVIEEIDRQVSSLWMDGQILEWLELKLMQVRESDEKKKIEQVENLKQEQNQIKEKLRKLLDGWEDEIIDDETYKTRVQQHKNRQKEIELLMKQISMNSDEVEGQINLTLELIENLGFQWFTLKNEQKAEVLKIMTEKIVLGKNGKDKPLIIWDLPWSLLFEMGTGSTVSSWYARQDSNLRPSDS